MRRGKRGGLWNDNLLILDQKWLCGEGQRDPDRVWLNQGTSGVGAASLIPRKTSRDDFPIEGDENFVRE